MLKIAMLTSTALVLATSMAIAATPAQSGFAFDVKAVPIQRNDSLLPQPAPNLYPLSMMMGTLPPTDEEGNIYWPCWTDTGNSACSSIPNGGLVAAAPTYEWSLSACDNDSPPATPCGQPYFLYQDLTNDSTDDLIVTVTVKQGSNFIFAVGPENHGPNPFAGETVVFSGEKAFGTQGQSGKGNGWCAGSKHTCVNPVAGLATGEAIVQVGPYEMKEKFNIWLQ